jgi:hypothetical protein
MQSSQQFDKFIHSFIAATRSSSRLSHKDALRTMETNSLLICSSQLPKTEIVSRPSFFADAIRSLLKCL